MVSFCEGAQFFEITLILSALLGEVGLALRVGDDAQLAKHVGVVPAAGSHLVLAGIEARVWDEAAGHCFRTTPVEGIACSISR